MDSSRSRGTSPYIVHIFARMDPGGAELRTAEVVRRVGLPSDFIATSKSSGQMDAALRAEGHMVYSVPLTFRNAFRYVRLFRSRGYTVAHSHFGIASGPFLLLAWLARTPRRIAHFHSDAVGGRRSFRKTVRLQFSRLLISIFATDLVGVSPGSLDNGWRTDWKSDSRCRVIANGFDASALRASAHRGLAEKPGRPLKVLNVGRPDPVKNRLRALQIWAEIAASTPVDLQFVGALSRLDEAAVLAAAKAPPIGSSIDIVGDTDVVAQYMVDSDVLLVTSTREGLPGVVLEALAIGTPVVASTLPGTDWIASLLPGIETCSLAESNSLWVGAVRRAADSDRDAIANAFDSSIFLIERSMAEFSRLWDLLDE